MVRTTTSPPVMAGAIASAWPLATAVASRGRRVLVLVQHHGLFHGAQAIHACCLNLKDKKIVSWDLMMNDLGLGMAGAACVIPLIGSIFAYYLREHTIEEIAIQKTYVHFKSYLEEMKNWQVVLEESNLSIYLEKTNRDQKTIATENQPIEYHFRNIQNPPPIASNEEERNGILQLRIEDQIDRNFFLFDFHANRILNEPYSLGNTSLRNALKERKDYEGEELEQSFNQLYYDLEWIRLLQEHYPKSEDAVIAIFNLIKK